MVWRTTRSDGNRRLPRLFSEQDTGPAEPPLPCPPLLRLIAPRPKLRQRPIARSVALAGLFVLTSCSMTTSISPAVRSELTPTGKLRVGINHGNFLLVTSYA